MQGQRGRRSGGALGWAVQRGGDGARVRSLQCDERTCAHTWPWRTGIGIPTQRG